MSEEAGAAFWCAMAAASVTLALALGLWAYITGWIDRREDRRLEKAYLALVDSWMRKR